MSTLQCRPGSPQGVTLSGGGAPSAELARRWDQARLTALERAIAQVQALGGDGIVAMHLAAVPLNDSDQVQELSVTGTAVRAYGPVRARRPFATHTNGEEFARLIMAGWVPVDLLFGTSIGVCHDAPPPARQANATRCRATAERHVAA